MPHGDTDAAVQTLIACWYCKREHPLAEMEAHTWDGFMWLCPECHERFHGHVPGCPQCEATDAE